MSVSVTDPAADESAGPSRTVRAAVAATSNTDGEGTR